jgi:hypothetical protein
MTSRGNDASSESNQDGARDFVRLAAAHRRKRLDAIDTIRLASAGVNIGVNESRPNGVHADAFRRDFFGETNRNVSIAPFDARSRRITGRAEPAAPDER